MFHQLLVWLFTPLIQLSPHFLDAFVMPANMFWMNGLGLIYLYEHWMKYYYYGGILG